LYPLDWLPKGYWKNWGLNDLPLNEILEHAIDAERRVAPRSRRPARKYDRRGGAC
jgi:hypothetical protein